MPRKSTETWMCTECWCDVVVMEEADGTIYHRCPKCNRMWKNQGGRRG